MRAGLFWVMSRSEARLGAAARTALGKIMVSSASGSGGAPVDAPRYLIGSAKRGAAAMWGRLEEAIEAEQALVIAYEDGAGATTSRLIFPVSIAFFDAVDILIAWCALREGFRHFRIDRISTLEQSGERWPRSRRRLLADWRAEEQASQPE